MFNGPTGGFLCQRGKAPVPCKNDPGCQGGGDGSVNHPNDLSGGGAFFHSNHPIDAETTQVIEFHLPSREVGGNDQSHTGVIAAELPQGVEWDWWRWVENVKEAGESFSPLQKGFQLPKGCGGRHPMRWIQSPDQSGTGPMIGRQQYDFVQWLCPNRGGWGFCRGGVYPMDSTVTAVP